MQPIRFTNTHDDSIAITYMGEDQFDYKAHEKALRHEAVRISVLNAKTALTASMKATAAYLRDWHPA